MRTNLKPKPARELRYNAPRTHEGAPAYSDLTPDQELRRSVLSCLLWENQFYENGIEIGTRIKQLAERCDPGTVARLAVAARSEQHLRHAPLLLLEVLTRTGAGSRIVSDTIERVIQRADELAEFLALYFGDMRHPLSAQTKKGLARAFRKFDAYQLAKYDRDGKVRLRDVLFLSHAKPENEAQEALWRKLADRALESPDTWEVGLSSGADKRETFTRLLSEGKLGYLALLRNLRGMSEANVDEGLIRTAILARKGGAQRVLPFRYVAAARACPRFEPELDRALNMAIAEMEPLPGKTIVLVDVSASMKQRLSSRSDLTRMDAAAALGAIVPGDVRVFSFSHSLVEVPPRKGMAGVDAIISSQMHGGTYLGAALDELGRNVQADRIIVITDEQSHDAVSAPPYERCFLINVASFKNGVGYGRWMHIDGFSEGVLRYIAAVEQG